MLKGLRLVDAHRLGEIQRLTGFPDVEGIETGRPWGRTSGRACLTGFPDVEGIETFWASPTADQLRSDRLP